MKAALGGHPQDSTLSIGGVLSADDAQTASASAPAPVRQGMDFQSLISKLGPQNNPALRLPVVAAKQLPAQASPTDAGAAEGLPADSTVSADSVTDSSGATPRRPQKVSTSPTPTVAVDPTVSLNLLALLQSMPQPQIIPNAVKEPATGGIAENAPAVWGDEKPAVAPPALFSETTPIATPATPLKAAVIPTDGNGAAKINGAAKTSPPPASSVSPKQAAPASSEVRVANPPTVDFKTADQSALPEDISKTLAQAATLSANPADDQEKMTRQAQAFVAGQPSGVGEDKSSVKINNTNGLSVKKTASSNSKNTAGTVNALNSSGMNDSQNRNTVDGRAMRNSQPDTNPVPAKDSADIAEISGKLPSPSKPVSPPVGGESDAAGSLATYFPGVVQTPFGAAPSSQSVSPQVDHVSKLIQQEVVTVRQSGAKELAVSLKVDGQTQLFLRVTNHGGQIQATLECEKGSMADLSRSMPDLQASLAKHNITLLEVTPVPTAGASAGFSQNNQNGNSTPGSAQQGQPQSFQAGQEKRQSANGAENNSGAEEPSAAPAKTHAVKPAAKSRADGWEQWA